MKGSLISFRILVPLLALFLLTLFTAPPVSLAQARNDNLPVLGQGPAPYGKSIAEWTKKWWTWVTKIPYDINPMFDPTGASCELGQNGPVWFLAGTGGGAVERSCTIPSNKSILFPVVNVLNDWRCPDPNFNPAPGQTLYQFLKEGAQFYIDTVNVGALEADVDGVPLQDLDQRRVTSKLLVFYPDPSLSLYDPCMSGAKEYGVSDGYWVMLPPLFPGQHTIHFRGNIQAFSFTTEVTYHLTIKP